MKLTISTLLVVVFLCFGCTTSDETREKGRDGTVAYFVEIESPEPGVRIEVDNETIGKTPVTWKVFGDKDGTFHNFGAYDVRVVGFPVRAGQQPQTKIFRTGSWFNSEDRIPKKLFFDFGPVPDQPK